jgi:branched-chain amino acid transport system ATP-binding protein
MAVADGGGAGTLEVRGASVHFEGVRALQDVDLTVHHGEVLGLIGPNGAGKTTLVNAISGFVRLTSGSMRMGGVTVTGWSAHRLAKAGLARTYQGAKLFGGLTAFENVEVGAISVGTRRSEARRLAWDLLALMKMEDRWDERAGGLPHGDERRLGMLRALASRPKFLLLDEPAAGLDDSESEELIATLARIRDRFSLGILLIDHDMKFVMGVCDRIQVLDHGQTIAVGAPSEVTADPRVREAYLGTHRKDAA